MRSYTFTAACAVAALLAVAGTPASAQYKGDPIKIGVMNDMAGAYADIAGKGSVWAAKKAVEDYGAAAKGMKVEIVSADHQNKPDVGSALARKWLESDGVDMITDVNTSSVGLAVNEVTASLNKAYVNVGSATSDLSGKACKATTIHWIYDTWMLANGTGSAIVKNGGDSWFFITADYAFGHALEKDTAAVVTANGGKVLGAIRAPFPTADFSSFMLQAQTSKAKVIGLANAGADTINSIKTAGEFGITTSGQQLAGLLVFLSDVHSLGLKTAQGLTFTDAWYWDTSDANRAFAKEFAAGNDGKYPTYDHAGVYSAVTHYLKAVEALGNAKDGKAVIDKMKAMETDDKLMGKGSVRADGRKIHPVNLVQVKKPEESKYPYDYYKVLATIPADKAFRPMADGGCPLVK
jgi:branched-chain amino acid transport system substrate-binding protein